MRKTVQWLLYGSTALVATLAAVPAFAQTTSPPPIEDATRLDEVVVTARRREENLQDVPGSVSALTGDALERRNITGLRELNAFVPNLSLSEAGTNANGAAVFIRGVGQSAPRVTLDPGVGIYVDGIYRQSLNGGFLSLLDVARIEVLRGPQGTLYGRNTIGGAIKIETRRPSLTTIEGRVSAGYGSFERVETSASVSLPLVQDRLGLKFGLSRRIAEGFIERIDGAATGDEDETGFQGQLLWRPNDVLTVLLNIDHVDARDLGLAKFVDAVNPAGTSVAFYNAAVASRRIAGPAFTASSVIVGDPRRTNETSPYARVNFRDNGGSIISTLDFGGPVLTSYTSYRENEQRDGFDLDGSALEVAANDRNFTNAQFSQELQLNTDLHPDVQLVAGLYYLESEDVQSALQLTAPAVAGAGGQDASSGTAATQNLTSYAAYAEARWAATPVLSASFGMRYVKDEKSVTGTSTRTALTRPVVTSQSASDDWSSVSPRLLIEYTPFDRQLFYASVTRGFKSGGINDTVNQGANPAPLGSFDPETLIAYELGSKSQFLGRRVTFNAAAFYSDYEDLQVLLLSATEFGLVRQFVNAGKARTYGLELEALAILGDHFRLNASAAYLNARFSEDVRDQSGTLIFVDGDALDRSPEFSYSVGAEYVSSPIGAGRLRARADYGWRDEQAYGLVGGASRLSSEAYGLLSGSLAYELGDLAISVFGKNLLDETYITGGLNVLSTSGASFKFLGTPREYGVRLTRRF